MAVKIFRLLAASLVALVFATFLAGCASPKIDWAGRIGGYTYDQAVVEFGPPDKQAKLEDGTIVADWLTRHGYTHSYGAGGYFGPRGYGSYSPYAGPYLESYSPDYFLRLTFGSEGKLKSWKKFAK